MIRSACSSIALVALSAAAWPAGAIASPAAPSHLALRDKGTTWARLAWHDNSANETRFQVRHRRGSGAWAKTDVHRNRSSFVHRRLSPARTYDYEVRACNGGGCSGWAGPLGIRTFSARIGCPLFPAYGGSATDPSSVNEDAWNQDISQAPTATNSAGVINYINAHGGDILHPDFGSPIGYGIPYIAVPSSQHRLPVHYTDYGDESDAGPYPTPLGAPVEGGSSSDGDRHVIVVRRGECKLYELYFAHPNRSHGRWDASSGAKFSLTGGGALEGRPGGFSRVEGFTSADAAGLPILPGLVRYDEARAGTINHAIRVTFDSTQNAYIHPATHIAGDTCASSAPPMGLRLRLNGGYSESGFNGPALAILRALKTYGMINADNGSNWFISGAQDTRWNDGNLNELKSIPGSAFEVVTSAGSIHSSCPP